MDKIRQRVHAIEQEVIAWRRHLHQNPELGFQEVNTTEFITQKLASFGIAVQTPTATGAVGILRGAKPGKIVAYRADIDALPILEDMGNHPRSLVDGVMHACGHDGHTACLLGAAKILAEMQEEIAGEIRFFFQPAEEVPPGGAKALVEAGAMDGVDLVFGMHFSTFDEPGLFLVKPGPLFASTFNFDIGVRGTGTHAAFPHKGTDTVLAAASLVCGLHTIVPRSIDSAQRSLLTVSSINGGKAHNIIPDTVTLGGTLRILDSRAEETLLQRIREMVDGICAAHGVKGELRLEKGYGLVKSDASAAAAVRSVLEKHFGPGQVTEPVPVLGGEDFSAYLTQAKGCYYRIGAMKRKPDGSISPAHQSRHEISDSALVYGVEGAVRILLEAPALID